jgi:hypothetical protein
MMDKCSLQQKFQITLPNKAEGGESWASADSAKRSREDQGFTPANAASVDMCRFNKMPPGMGIDDQDRTQINPMSLTPAGTTDASRDTNQTSMNDGFKVRDLNGHDDQNTGKGADLFYDEVGGFTERANYLDRM